ncbi:MAG TPA: hypothetical protein VNS09_20495 [Solirubrobacter sp.]|nr:hypothetical protein [Solirubrobacter sp.]
MAAHTAPAHPTHHSAVAWTAIGEAVTYWAGMAAVYMSFGFLWYYAAKEKLFDQNATMPAGLAKSYDGSFIASFPGVNTAWLLLGLVEAVAFLGVIASLVAGEFLRGHHKPVLMATLAFSMFTFALMTFAQNMIGANDSVASLFTYMGVTAVILAVIKYVPPFRGEPTDS